MKKSYIIILFFLSGLLSNRLSAMPYYQDNNDKKFYTSLEYLLWQPQEDQLQYALVVPGGTTGKGMISGTSFIYDQCFKIGAGFRATVGYNYCQNWDTAFAWTHFKKCSFGNTPTIPTGIIATALFALLDDATSSSADSTWSLALNGFDIEIARTHCTFDALIARLHMGVKGFSIQQKQVINYAGVADNITGTVVRNNNFLAIGPRVGINTQWYVGGHTNIIGDLSGSLLYGKFDVNVGNFIYQNNILIASPNFITCTHRIRPTAQMLLGLNWDKEIGDIVLEITTAYEVQYWWNQWKAGSIITTIAGLNSEGDLMTHGLTVGLGVHF